MTDSNLWQNVVQELSAQIKRPDFIVWFKGTALLSIENNKALIGLPSIFAKEWFQKKYSGLIIDTFKKFNADVVDIDYIVDASLLDQESDGINTNDYFKGESGKKVRKLPGKKEIKVTFTDKNSGSTSYLTSRMLNPKFRLDNFVVGADNRLAHAACQAVARKPGMAYNPLFVYGGVGLGKTHLLQAAGNAILHNYPDSVIVYGTAEKFTNEIIESIKNGNVKGIRDRYRRVDCLIIDDIQFLAGKDRTQEEFFHTFNELYQENKQIIISSDRPPKELKDIESRLVSRFEMGMIVDVTFPDYETCLAILHRKCQEMQVLIPADVLEFIAYNTQSSIRELEGVLVQVIAQSQLENATPSVYSVEKLMRKLGKVNLVTNIDTNQKKPMTSCDEIIDLVAEYYKLTKYDLIGERRNREIMTPRQVCIYLLRKEYNFSFEKIGEEFGGRNHTTAMHAFQKIVKTLKKDQKLVRDINAIKKEIGI
jgi:chromosomal replication initiator protein